jgi:hypothetical protein
MRLVTTALASFALVGGMLLPESAPAAPGRHHDRLSTNARPRGQTHHRYPNSHASVRAHASIIGGQRAQVGTFPWLTEIFYGEGRGLYACTGTVVAPNLILTAGHCAENPETGIVNNPSGYTVVTGAVNWTSPERQVSGLSKVLVYPSYERGGLLEGSGDAALLALSRSTTAPAIPLATASDSSLWQPGTGAVVAGWGNTYYGQTGPTEWLQWAETVVQGQEWCKNHAPGFRPLGQLCALNPPAYETGTCNGDSGGPLLAIRPGTEETVEVGITHSGPPHCGTTSPDVFTRAELVSSWVRSWIKALNPPPTPLPAPTRPPAQASAVTPATQSAPPPPPNTPGYYVTKPSKLRKIVIHVSGDGAHVVGVRIKMPVNCQHGHALSLNKSWLSSADNSPITNHTVRTTLEWSASRETKRGTIGVYLHFTSPGTLEGQVRVRLPYRSRHIGLCSGALRFTAKT